MKYFILALLATSVICNQPGDRDTGAACTDGLYDCIYASDLGCDITTTDSEVCASTTVDCTAGIQEGTCTAKFGQAFSTCTDGTTCTTCANDDACIGTTNWSTCTTFEVDSRDENAAFGCIDKPVTDGDETECTHEKYGLISSTNCIACTLTDGVTAGCSAVTGKAVCNGTGECVQCTADAKTACTGNTPICVDNVCAACTADSCGDDMLCVTTAEDAKLGECYAEITGCGTYSTDYATCETCTSGTINDAKTECTGATETVETTDETVETTDETVETTDETVETTDETVETVAATNDTSVTTCDVTALADVGCVGCAAGAEVCVNCKDGLEIGGQGCKCPGDKIPDTANGCVDAPADAPTCAEGEELAVVDGTASCLTGADLTDAIKKGNEAAAAAAEEAAEDDAASGLLLSILSVISMIILA